MLSDYISDLKQSIAAFDLQQVYADAIAGNGYDVRALHAFAFNLCYLLDAEYQSSNDHSRVCSILSRLNQCQPPILLPELRHLLSTLHRIRQYLLKLTLPITCPRLLSSLSTLNAIASIGTYPVVLTSFLQ